MTITVTPGEAIVIEGKDSIGLYRIMALEKMLKLELMGIKHSRGSVYAVVKKEFGLKGNKQKVYEQYKEIVAKAKATHLRNA
jgi:hypothetical protein